MVQVGYPEENPIDANLQVFHTVGRRGHSRNTQLFPGNEDLYSCADAQRIEEVNLAIQKWMGR